jgi:hypothetical protein
VQCTIGAEVKDAMKNHNSALDLVGCPECNASAEVVDRFVLTSTDGPVEHVKVHCINRHWHTAAADTLPAVPAGLTVNHEPVRETY